MLLPGGGGMAVSMKPGVQA